MVFLRFELGKMMSGDLFLSFMVICLSVVVVLVMICFLVGIEFVRDILVMLGCFISVWLVCLLFWIMLKMLLGSLYLVKILVSFSVVVGVNFEGLKIMVLFVVNVGVVFYVVIWRG